MNFSPPSLIIVAILAVVVAFISSEPGKRRIVVCSVVIPAIIQIVVALWLIVTIEGFLSLGVFILAIFAIPGGLIANVLIHMKWKTSSPWWATARGAIVAALACATVFFVLMQLGR